MNDAQQPDRPWASRNRSYGDYTFTERRDGWIIIRSSSGESCSIPPEARYTLARVMLADQPFGFTPEDAERLRSIDPADYETQRWAEGFADRIDRLQFDWEDNISVDVPGWCFVVGTAVTTIALCMGSIAVVLEFGWLGLLFVPPMLPIRQQES